MARKYNEKPQNSSNHNNKNNNFNHQKKNNKNNNSSNTSTINNKPNQNQTVKPTNQAIINNLNKFAAFGKKFNTLNTSVNDKKTQQSPTEPINTSVTLNTSTISGANLQNVPKQIGGNLLQKGIKNPCPSAQQVSQTIKSLKILEQLLDSYQQLQMDQNCDLKKLIEYIQNNKASQKVQKQG